MSSVSNVVYFICQRTLQIIILCNNTFIMNNNNHSAYSLICDKISDNRKTSLLCAKQLVLLIKAQKIDYIYWFKVRVLNTRQKSCLQLMAKYFNEVTRSTCIYTRNRSNATIFDAKNTLSVSHSV